MSATTSLIETWREVGPIEWAESRYGWITEGAQPITLEPWQRAVLEAWWENRRDVTTLAISNVKKTGKTTLNAILLAWRWLALPAEHFAVGNDFDQSAARQFAMIAKMVERHPYLSRHVKVTGSRLTFLPSGSTIEALAADAAGNAGANHLTASHTEAWGIVYEAGVRAFEELTPPPGQRYGFRALRVCDSYAGWQGESATWHSIVDRGLQGERVCEEWPIFRVDGLLLFHLSGPSARSRCYRGTPEEAAKYYGDEAASLRVAQFARMHGNERMVNAEEVFVPSEWWDACLGEPPPLNRASLFLAMDAGISSDCFAIVGVSRHQEQVILEDGKTVSVTKVAKRYARAWHPPRGGKLKFRNEENPLDPDYPEGELLRLLREYNVLEVAYDPYQLHDMVTRLAGKGNFVEVSQGAERMVADKQLRDAIRDRRIVHDGDAELTQHIRNANVKASETGEVNKLRIVKRAQNLKIDLAVALSMANYRALFGVALAEDWLKSVRQIAQTPSNPPLSVTGTSEIPAAPAISTPALQDPRRLGLPPEIGQALPARPPARWPR